MISENADVLTEIFLRLPTKSVIRFKLVCKRWRSLISDHHFSHLHTVYCRRRLSKPEPFLLLHRPKSAQYYLLHCGLYGAKLVQYHFPTPLVTPSICNFSNGLFLLRCDSLETAPEYCHVYNPTTKQSRQILLNVNERYTCVVGMNIAFDPLKSPYFKIICVRSARRRISGFLRSWMRRCQIEVYESDTNTWKICVEQFFVPNELDFNRGVYWNDAIHWRGLFFDLNINAIGQHPVIMVREDYGIDAVENYVEANGYLNCIAHFTKEKLVEVFELQPDYSEWISKFRLSFDRELSVLGIYWGDSEEDSKLVVHESGKVMTCGFEGKMFKDVIGVEQDLFEKNCLKYDSRFSFQFLETLAPV